MHPDALTIDTVVARFRPAGRPVGRPTPQSLEPLLEMSRARRRRRPAGRPVAAGVPEDARAKPPRVAPSRARKTRDGRRSGADTVAPGLGRAEGPGRPGRVGTSETGLEPDCVIK